MAKIGERWTRNPDGSTEKVPADMRFEEWRGRFIKPANVEVDKTSLTLPTKEATVKLSDAEQRALNEYVSSGSYKINALLRDGVSLTKEQQVMVDALDAALEKLPVYKGAVYRSLNSAMMDVNGFWNEHIPGNIVRYPAYTSSGTVVYDETMDIQMIIQSKTARDIRKFNPGEHEILFPRNSAFSVVRREGNTLWLEEI